MSDEDVEEVPRTYSGALLAAIAVALLLGIGGLIWSYTLSGKVGAPQQELADAKAQNVKLDAQLRETDERLNVATDELKTSLGLTQKQLDSRAQELQVRESREEAASARLASEQKQTAQQVSQVSSAKTDVAKTQSDLATAVAQLTSMKGDLDGHSTLIARNAQELDVLKHKGDRSYYELTLVKGQRKPVGTVSLELKKTDTKHSKFTLVVYADDKEYEKRDKN